MTALTEQCYLCKKWISDDEWVDNWGSCHECMSASLEEYYANNPTSSDAFNTDVSIGPVSEPFGPES